MTQPLMKITGLEGGYGDIKILNGVNIEVPDKAIVTIVGPNGAGKSTIMKAIYGIAKVTAGSATIMRGGKEVNILGTKPYNLSKIGIGYVPQIENIFVGMTIDENLDVGYIPESGKTLEELKEAMYVRYPDLVSRKRDRAGQLSGGQRQMLALARALMSAPDVLLLDEPSAGLAPALVDQLFDELVRINQSGVTILMVEQNARRALEISTYGYFLDMGKNRHEGPGAELSVDPKIVGIYFGKRTT